MDRNRLQIPWGAECGIDEDRLKCVCAHAFRDQGRQLADEGMAENHDRLDLDVLHLPPPGRHCRVPACAHRRCWRVPAVDVRASTSDRGFRPIANASGTAVAMTSPDA
jgi:hypothetical protein